MVSTMMSFSAALEPWIPVVSRDGRCEVSLQDLLLDAHNWLDLAASDPLEAVGLFRTALAAVIDACGQPATRAEWAERWASGRFPEAEVRAYFEAHADNFDLFSAERPFLQAPGLQPSSGGAKSVSALLLSVASGNNTPLFTSSTERTIAPLRPAEALRALLATQAYDTAAIKGGAAGDPQVKGGKTSGNPTGYAGRLGHVVPVGRNLFESLMLAMPVGETNTGDLPPWRLDPPGPSWQERDARGVVDLLTWPSRRIRLIAGTVDGETVVTGVVLTAGDRITFVPPKVEPFTLWNAVDAKSADVSHRPRRHRTGQAAWRGLGPILGRAPSQGAGVETAEFLTTIGRLVEYESLDEDYPLNLRITGVEYGNQSAVIENVIADSIPLPVMALASSDREVSDLLMEMVENAESVAKALDFLDMDLRDSRGGEPIPWDKGMKQSERFFAAIDGATRLVLSELRSLPEDTNGPLSRWAIAVREIAVEMAERQLDAVGPQSFFVGRKAKDTPANEKRVHVAVARAEASFWWQLKKALPRAASGITSKEG